MARTIQPLWIVPLLGILSMFQASLMGLFTIYGVKPELVLIVILAWSLTFGSSETLVWAFIGGIWLDIFSGGPMGASSIALMTASLVAGVGYRSLSRFNILVPLFVVIVGSLTFSFIYLGILELLDATGLLSGSLDLVGAVENIVFPTMLYNTSIMLLIIPLLNGRPDELDAIQ